MVHGLVVVEAGLRGLAARQGGGGRAKGCETARPVCCCYCQAALTAWMRSSRVLIRTLQARLSLLAWQKIPKSVGFASRLPLLLSIYATRAGWQMGNLIDRHSFTRLATGVAGAPASNAAACLAESWDCCGSPRASGATMICNRTSKAAQPRRALAASTRSAPPKIGWAGSAREWLGSG